jgi:hypothetical protein
MLRKKIVLGYFKVDTHARINNTHTGDLHRISICNRDLTKIFGIYGLLNNYVNSVS